MKTIYYSMDGEWYPMINVYEDRESPWGGINGAPLELDDETASFILAAYKNFDKAHDMIKEILESKGLEV